jgi:ABC-2 type transport system ATP-binding protein
MTPTVLALENVRRSYKQGSEALKGINLSVKAGEVVGLIGRNGAGKTTLLRIAVGILQSHSGTVRVFEMDPWSHAVEVKRRIGYVAETQAIPTHLTVRGLMVAMEPPGPPRRAPIPDSSFVEV